MPFKNLEDALRNALAAAGPGANPAADLHSLGETLVEQHVLQCVRGLPGIERFADGTETMIGFGRGWRSLDATGIGHAAFRRAKATDAASAVADLRRFLHSSHFTARQSMLLTAVKIPCPIPLANGLSLIPFQGGDPENKRFIPGIPERDHRDVSKITAAIIKDHQCEVQVGPLSRVKGTSPHSELWDFEELEEARLCISLIGPSGPTSVSTSIATLEWIPGEGGALGQHPKIGETRHAVTLNEGDGVDLQDVHRQFCALPLGFRKQLRVAMRRLNMAMRRSWDVDAAIDLGIALEVLFYDQPPSQGTIGFTIRLRAARMLGHSLAERKAIAALVKRVYGIRSTAAHTGILPTGGDVSIALDDGARLVAKSIRRLISVGPVDWESIELG